MNDDDFMKQVIADFDQKIDEYELVKFDTPIPSEKSARYPKRTYKILDQDALQIAYIRLRNYARLENPILKRTSKDGMPFAMSVKFPLSDIELTIRAFGGDVNIGGKFVKNEEALSGIIAKKMTNTFGEGYKIAYCKYWISTARKSVRHGGDVVEMSDQLERRLLQVGKKTDTPHLMIWNKGLRIEDLEDV